MAVASSVKKFIALALVAVSGLFLAVKGFDYVSYTWGGTVRVDVPAGTTVVFEIDHILDAISGPVVVEQRAGLLSDADRKITQSLQAKSCSLWVTIDWDNQSSRHQSGRVDMVCGERDPVALKATWHGRDGAPGDNQIAVGERVRVVVNEAVSLRI